jgi:transglutaminase-like putative cysteine protease
VRLAPLAVVVLCLAGVALAAPQLATDESPLAAPFGDDAEPDYGPVEGSYFRVTSYDRYTGTGWQRTADADSTAALEPPPGQSETVRVRYEARDPVRTLPAPWRPTRYEGPDASAYEGSLEPAAPLERGETFTVTARRPVWTADDLRTAGTDYPAGLERRYTQLPAETPPGLASRAGEVTAGAETPYETAVAVNRWLRTEKNYSLSVDRPDEAVATAFAEEMDAGYCQYFATTMAAMLRAEGVPARYVSGYTPYEQVGAGEHVIRGKYAHTWVEVYFPGTGWVPFDPTPPEERQSARGVETADAGAESGGDENGPETAAFRGPAGVAAAATVQDDEGAGWRQLDADIEVEGDVAPGNRVTVRVADPDDGSPIAGAQVRFNGHPVGETDADGEVVGEVPYEEELRVAAYAYGGEGDPPPVDAGGSGSGAASGEISNGLRDLRYAAPETEISGSLTDLSDEVLFRASVEDGSVVRQGDPAPRDADRASLRPERATSALPSERLRMQSPGSERTFELPTEVDVSLAPSDESRPGAPLTVTATLEGRPVADATVTAGAATATTDEEGRATVPTPYERPAEVVVERGAARGEAAVPVTGSLAVDVDDESRPGAPLTVRATVDDRPVAGATVSNGVETATTNERGVATLPAPYESPGNVTVERGDFSASVERDVAVDEPTVVVADPAPGRRVLVRGLVGDEPMRNAVVELDGEPVGDTDRSGRGEVTFPYRESLTVAVARGDVRAERTVELPTDVRLETDGRAVPGGSVDLRATVGGRPVENGTVVVGGERVGQTNVDGETTVDVPLFAAALDVRVERGAVAGERRVGHLWIYWVSFLGALSVVVAAGRRRGYLERLRRDPRALSEAAVGAAVALYESLAADLERTLATRDAGAASPSGGAGRSRPTDEDAPAFLVESARDNGVFRAWMALAAGLEGTQRTPAAVAEEAVERGLPEDAVAELTELFREVRYGDAEPTEERERRAKEALSRIREAAR